ncbi:SDR family oxidoreductase [Variovorax saccharolyticus]|uniref:SDR family oxidoreductase n=1 Tax=Variovorax saccharolyticus TaxID=3053516 RepID=UPI002575C80E|nr:SDR family NAD(P)-dependent oxidoreductase [Variovorax sp. J22R187]MDM0018766.1 SDR family oxidoreductase [Variovorax sp. J22R187]
MNFQDKTVVITGAAGNLGRVVARRFADEGAQLVLIDLQTGDLESDFPNRERHLLVEANLLQHDEVVAAVDKAMARFGRIDVLCNLAGGFRMGEAVHETSQSNWEFLLGLNAGSVLNMSRAVVPRMLAAGAGKIVNVGAFAAQKGAAQMGAYVASKSVVMRLTESLAAELREQGINVNCVLPTIIDTPENRLAMPGADPSRWVAPEDLANAILFLASDQARAIHGASLPVSGLS